MLLKVDVHPGSQDHESSIEKCTSHYISLGTGDRWSLGRKNSTLEVKDDKTLSREHISLSFVTTNAKYTDTTPQAKDPSHIRACEANNGICLVLQNSGKLGTFLVIQEEKKRDDQGVKDDQNGDDSDATDDEMDLQYTSQQSGSQVDVALSPVSKIYVSTTGTIGTTGPTLTRLEPIPLNATLPLDVWPNCPFLLQCGKFGTTVVITRLRFNLVSSGNAKSVISELPLYRIGGTELDRITKDITDYIVTPSYSVSSKHLAAWCLGIPFVTADYIQAWIDRKAPQDPVPSPNDFAPASDSSTFWKTSHQGHLFRLCTLLLTRPPVPDELELLCQAAGITQVVPLYDDKGIFADDTIKNIVSSAKHCFAMDSRRKIAKLLTKLKVPLVTSRELAKAITEQRALMDRNGNEVAPVLIDPLSLVDSTDQQTKPYVEISDKKTTKQNASRNADRGKVETKYDKVSMNMDIPTTKMDVDSRPTKTTLGSVGHNKPNEPDQDAFPEPDELDHNPNEPDQDGFPEPDELDHKEDQKEEVAFPLKRLRVENDSITLASRGQERKQRTIGHGWLQALPHGKERQKYQRSVDEIKALTGVDEVHAASTVVVSGLVQRPLSSRQASSLQDSGPNFKAFRKSNVLPILSTKVKLFPATAQGHRTRRVESDDDEIEQQQRMADELFRTGTSQQLRR